ncbi:MAG: hypothetical protein AAB522_01345, partial [Patescibacteria group bacterium]
MKKAWLVLCLMVFVCANTFALSVKISQKTVSQGGFFEITIDGVQRVDEVFIATFQQKKYQSARVETAHLHRIIIPVGALAIPEEAEIKIEGKYEILLPLKVTTEKSDFGESKKV